MPPAFGDNNNQGGGVNYYPNDQVAQGAPGPVAEVAEPPMPILGEAWLKVWDTQHADNFTQAGTLYRIMSDAQKDTLTQNIAGGLSRAGKSVQERMLGYFAEADADYAKRIQKFMVAIK